MQHRVRGGETRPRRDAYPFEDTYAAVLPTAPTILVLVAYNYSPPRRPNSARSPT